MMVLPLGYSYFLRGSSGWVDGLTSGVMLDKDGRAVSTASEIEDAEAFRGEQNAIGAFDFQDGNPDLYFLLCQGVLHSDIPPDPNSPYTIPHPDYYDRFLMACGIGYPNWLVTNGIADPNRLAAGYWDNAPDRKKGWIYFIPEDTSLTAVVTEMYAWFRQYGPLPEDEEITEGLWGTGKYPGPQNDIERERHVFWYAWKPETHHFFVRGIAEGNLCCQVMGWSKSTQTWVYPRDWSEDIKVWMKRGPNEWKYFFNLIKWMNANASTIGTTSLQIAGSILAAYTGGASTPFIQALVKGITNLMTLGTQGADGGTILFTMFQTSAAMVQAADEQGAFANLKREITKSVGAGAGKIVGWAEDVGKPFVKMYQTMTELTKAGSPYYTALANAAKLGGVNLPKIDGDFLEKALTNSVLGEASYWAKKAASFSDPKQIEAYINSIPDYAKEVASFGGMLRMVQFQQVSQGSSSLHFQLGKTTVNQPGAFGVLQVRADLANILGMPKAKYGTVVAPTVGTTGIPLPSSAVETLPKAVQVGAVAVVGATLLYLLRDYGITKLFDAVVKKVS